MVNMFIGKLVNTKQKTITTTQPGLQTGVLPEKIKQS